MRDRFRTVGNDLEQMLLHSQEIKKVKFLTMPKKREGNSL